MIFSKNKNTSCKRIRESLKKKVERKALKMLCEKCINGSLMGQTTSKQKNKLNIVCQITIWIYGVDALLRLWANTPRVSTCDHRRSTTHLFLCVVSVWWGMRGVRSVCSITSGVFSRATMAEAVQNHVRSLNWGHRVQLQDKWVTPDLLALFILMMMFYLIVDLKAVKLQFTTTICLLKSIPSTVYKKYDVLSMSHFPPSL